MMREVITLGDLAREGRVAVNDGYRTRADQLGQPGVPILRVAEVQDGFIDPSFGDHVLEELRPKFGPKASAAGDVVVTTKGTVGRVARIRHGDPEFVYSPQVCFFRCAADSGVRADWLYYWFKSPEFVDQAMGVQSQTDMAAYINLADMRSLKITVPTLAEQSEIAAVLGALDDKIESNRRLLTLLEADAQVRFGRDFDVEPGADGVLLSELVDVNPKRALRGGTEAPYVAMADLPTSTALIDSWTVRAAGSGQRFVNGDTLVARITPCLENGKTAFVDMLDDHQVGWGSTEYIVLRSVAPLPLEWAYCLARSEHFREFAIRNMTGTSGRQRCPASAFDAYRLQAPDPSAIARFARAIAGSFARMGKARDESRVLADLRDALLPELLSGRMRVRDVEAIAGEVA